MIRGAVTAVAAAAIVAVAFVPVPVNAVEYGPPGYVNSKGKPVVMPELTVVKVQPGKWRKRNPYVPTMGKIYFTVTVEKGLYSALSCTGLSWQNFYDKTNIRSGRTYRISVASANPAAWTQPAVYECVVGTLVTGVPEPEDWDWRLGPWTGETYLVSETVRVEVPAVAAGRR